MLSEAKHLYSGTRRSGVVRSAVSGVGERFFARGLRMTEVGGRRECPAITRIPNEHRIGPIVLSLGEASSF